MTEIGYRWHPLEDLPDDYAELCEPELSQLAAIWEDQRGELTELQALKEFNRRLLRRWAIETGIIERVYTLDRGVTQLLIERGLDASLIPAHATDKNPELVIQIIRDQHDAAEGLFDFVRNRRQLSTSYVYELHSMLLAHQRDVEARDPDGNLVQVPLERGTYKKWPNNPIRPDGSIHEYCPPEQVASEMDRLIELHHLHVEEGVPTEVEAAWLHHRFTQIHPFQDGNGRVARSLATLEVIRAGWFPLVVTVDHRSDYIDALEAADHGDLEPLVQLFVRIQKRAFLGALSVARDVVERDRQVHRIVDSIRDSFLRRKAVLREEWENSKVLAEGLHEDASNRLGRIADELHREIKPLAPDGVRFDFWVSAGRDEDPERRRYNIIQVVETAKALEYFANTKVFHSWVRLDLVTDSHRELLISLHGIGHEFRGILVASAGYVTRETADEGRTVIAGVQPVAEELFQINYRESLAEVRSRFEKWLDVVVLTALEMWRSEV